MATGILLNRSFCPKCEDKNTCSFAKNFYRLPKAIGGEALCPRLKDNTDPQYEG